jgi:hypothetical protein
MTRQLPYILAVSSFGLLGCLSSAPTSSPQEEQIKSEPFVEIRGETPETTELVTCMVEEVGSKVERTNASHLALATNDRDLLLAYNQSTNGAPAPEIAELFVVSLRGLLTTPGYPVQWGALMGGVGSLVYSPVGRDFRVTGHSLYTKAGATQWLWGETRVNTLGVGGSTFNSDTSFTNRDYYAASSILEDFFGQGDGRYPGEVYVGRVNTLGAWVEVNPLHPTLRGGCYQVGAASTNGAAVSFLVRGKRSCGQAQCDVLDLISTSRGMLISQKEIAREVPDYEPLGFCGHYAFVPLLLTESGAAIYRVQRPGLPDATYLVPAGKTPVELPHGIMQIVPYFNNGFAAIAIEQDWLRKSTTEYFYLLDKDGVVETKVELAKDPVFIDRATAHPLPQASVVTIGSGFFGVGLLTNQFIRVIFFVIDG